MFQLLGTSRSKTPMPRGLVEVDPARFDDNADDLPCPWCRAATSEADIACPSCGRAFGDLQIRT